MARKQGRPRAADGGKRSKRLNATASQNELDAFNAACARVKLDPADALRLLAEAFVERVKAHGTVELPLKIADAKGT